MPDVTLPWLTTLIWAYCWRLLSAFVSDNWREFETF